MALKGKITMYQYTEHETEKENILVEYPTDLAEDDPNYDKRGTSETIEVPKVVENSEVLDDMYIKILHMGLVNHSGKGEKRLVWSINLRGYKTKAQSDEAGTDFDWETHFHLDDGKLADVISDDKNPYKEAYALLKKRKGFENLIDS